MHPVLLETQSQTDALFLLMAVRATTDHITHMQFCHLIIGDRT